MRRRDSEFGDLGGLVKFSQRDQRARPHAQNTCRECTVWIKPLRVIHGPKSSLETTADYEHITKRIMPHRIIRIKIDTLLGEA